MRLLFLGTSSGAGKTTVCAAACRLFARMGLDPVPFKALNLSLNSYATEDGGEIGMGQAFQAWSAGLEPETDMNPVLLKPSGGGVTQMVLRGKPYADISRGRPLDRGAAMEAVRAAYGRLSSEHRTVLCEGSGSPAELNLMDRDIANVGLMRETGVPAVLVADIERGGVFAAVYGTWLLMPEDVRPLLRGFIVNRFRGEPSILASGIEEVERLTGMRCLGVLPYMDLRFPEEDSLSSSEGRMEGSDARTAFMANIDAMADVLEREADIGALLEIAEDRWRSSARGDPEGPDLAVRGGHGVHRDRGASDEEDVGVRMLPGGGDRLGYGGALGHRHGAAVD